MLKTDDITTMLPRGKEIKKMKKPTRLVDLHDPSDGNIKLYSQIRNEQSQSQSDEIDSGFTHVNQNTLTNKRLNRRLQRLQDQNLQESRRGNRKNEEFEAETTVHPTTVMMQETTTTPGFEKLLSADGFDIENIPNFLNDFIGFTAEQGEEEEYEEDEYYQDDYGLYTSPHSRITTFMLQTNTMSNMKMKLTMTLSMTPNTMPSMNTRLNTEANSNTIPSMMQFMNQNTNQLLYLLL